MQKKCQTWVVVAAKTNAFWGAVAVHMGVKDVQGRVMMAVVLLAWENVVVIVKVIAVVIAWAIVRKPVKVVVKIHVVAVARILVQEVQSNRRNCNIYRVVIR